MDDLLKAIDRRRSRRKYLQTPIAPEALAKLRDLIKGLREDKNLNMQLVLEDGDAFNGLRKSYGMFSGVQNYVVQIGNKEDAVTKEQMGYYGELLVLHATVLGLGTCWVGGTYDQSLCPVALEGGDRILCTIVVGNVDSSLSAKERFFRWGTHRKTKTVEQMYTADAEVPDWFLAGMNAVQKAPSAVNRQPAMFAYQNGVVRASVEGSSDAFSALDLGIAKLHFELGAGGGTWAWGNEAVFEKG